MSEKAENMRTWAVTVTTKPTRVAPKNSKRKAILIYNNGDATIYIIDSPSKGINDGIPVPAKSDYTNRWTTAEIWAVAESGSQDVRVEEDA